jgi:hypothetical protein
MVETKSPQRKTLKRLTLQPHHVPTGNTTHKLCSPYGTQKDFAPFVRLEIAQYEGDTGFYLLYYTETGHGTDTWHLSLEDALHQAEFGFNVQPDEWVRAEESSS